jgi:hypothetical protein
MTGKRPDGWKDMPPGDDFSPTPARAFPTAHSEFSGMTLRDYFAAAALTGILAGDQLEGRRGDAVWTEAEVAARIYGIADAMLKEREK